MSSVIEGVNFVGNSISKSGTETLQAVDPAKNSALPEQFSVATEEEINEAVEKAYAAFQNYSRLSGQKKAVFLDAIAEEIMALGDSLIHRATLESGLPNGRFEGERGRTVNQIKMFADLLREGSWVDARIDTAKPDREPLPKPDIRNMLFPLGPVAVFGASNFPLAFSTAGGDTISALAAGCPVVVKSHESHPGTNELVAGAIIKAAKRCNLPDGVFSSLNGKARTGQQLIRHPLIKAVGFTGSLKAGNAILKTASERNEPIPVYAEMGSVNPVFLLNEKLDSSAEELAKTYFQSVTLGRGQFCTKPGLLIAQKGSALEQFSKALSNHLSEYTAECLLNRGVAENYRKNRDELLNQSGVNAITENKGENDLFGNAALASVNAGDFLQNSNLREEVFGPFTLIVECDDYKQMKSVADAIEGQLTITFMGNDNELQEQQELVHLSRQKAGRIIFNGVPTGVEVCHSMHHGGPYPATTDSKFTSVGTGAIRRFTRPVAYQDFPKELLPDELRDDNPLKIHRLVDGAYQR